ncbi:hypothetical protein [Vulcanisaeta distributa]|uniref:hypothetical protein n=1 Tax=Vulcanisaeta distributa TaxID=164451 RepID=UPI000A61FE57|nr:hypothetical protein [Vulcanisaeta distributa]
MARGGTAAVDLKVRVRVKEGHCGMSDFVGFVINYLRSKLGLGGMTYVSRLIVRFRRAAALRAIVPLPWV